MYPILYSADETDFTHNGLGILRDSISATATEEANGQFELHIEYDSDGIFADVIDYEMIIKAKANDKQDLQLFRIYAINKSLENDNLVIDAQHITYDLAGNFVESLELDEATAAEAMETIQNNLAYPTRFTISSDNTVTKSSTKLYRTNPLQMIGGIDGSIIDNWGGEIERDNFRLILHAKRGSDDGVLVSYEKNLTGLEAKFDISNVVTRIFPFKALEDGTVLTIPGKYIDSPNINAYNFIRILPVDYSQDEDVIDQDSLYAKSSTYFSSGGHDQPTVTMEVTFESLWKTEEYKDVAALELVGMGDTITVHHKKMNVDATTKVVKIEYDVISEKNAKVTAGSLQTSLSNTVNNVTDGVQNTIDQAISAANTAIQAANGKNTIYYGPDEPTDAQKGDLWFKVVNGEYTRTYRFDGVQWQLVMDMDVTLVQQDVANALSQANNAVSTANQATQNAQNAIDKAQDGFDKAQAALTAANNATDTANTAKQVASDAATQAGTAKANAQTAMSNAQDAINKANAANDNANTREKSIIKSNTAPSNPATDQLWIDTSKTPQIMRRWNGSTWVDLSPTQANQIGAVSSTTYTTDITNINNTLSQIASITTVNTLSGRVDEAETAITQNANDIALKADKNVVDTLKNIVDNHSTLISQNADAIALKASQSTVDALTGRVSTAEATLTTQANQIAARITKTDADAKYATQSSLTQTSSSLTSQITAVQTDLNNLQIGGTNLLPNTKDYNGWNRIDSSASLMTDTYNGCLVQQQTSDWHYYRVLNQPQLQAGKTYTASVWLKASVGGVLNPYYSHETATSGGTSTITHSLKSVDGDAKVTTEWKRYYVTFTATGFNVGSGARVEANNFGTSGAVLYIAGIKLELGDKATDYSPSPSDLTTNVQFSSLQQTVDSISTNVTNAQGDISTLQQTANSLTTRIGTAEGNITTLTQTTNGLQTTVSGKVDTTTYNSFVTQTNTALQSKLSVQDAASTYATQSSLTQTADSLTSKITSVQTNLNNLQVGVRNLALQTGNPFTMSSFSNINNQTANVYNINQNELNGHVYISCDVTVSGIVGDSTTGTPGMRLQFYTYDNNNTSHWDAVSNIPLTDGAYKISVPLSANYVAGYKQAYVQLRADYIKSGTVTVKNFMVTIGNRYVGWSPAPEDLATQSQISQLSDDINLRVQKNDVINQINVSTESILISGNKVHITGQTTIDNAVITSAMIQSIDAGKITAGTLDASKVSVVNLNASNIKSGTLNAITINGGTGSFTGKVQTIYTSGGNTLGTEMFSGGMYAASSYGNTVEYGADSIQLKSYPSSISVDQSSIYNSVSNNRGKETLTTDISPASITLNALTTAGQYLTGKYLDIEITTSKADISSNVDLYVESLSGDLYLDSSAFGTIYIGGNTINLLGKVNFTWDSFNSALTVSKAMQVGNIRLNGANTITNFSTTMYVSGTTGVELSGSGASLSVGSDSSGARIYSPSFSSRTYTSSANAHITSAGVIGITSSARKYKLDEQQVPDEISYRILNVVPKTWFDKRTIETYSDLLTRQAHGEQIDWDAEDIPYIERVPGVVAEDVEDAGLNQYVIYSDPDENGTRTIESVMYDRLWTLLIPIAKDHNDQISILLEQNQNLILKVAELESRLAKLEVA